jgi:uncharacterized protein YqhQ
MQRYTVYFICKLFYMFRVVPPPIIRSANNCIYGIWYLSRRYCHLPPVWQITGAVDTVVCAPDDGWRYHPKHVEQFPGINKRCNVASCWIYIGILIFSLIPIMFYSFSNVPLRHKYLGRSLLVGVPSQSCTVLFTSPSDLKFLRRAFFRGQKR